MKLVPLTCGQFAIVEDQDFDLVNQFKWRLLEKKSEKMLYAVREQHLGPGKSRSVLMHRLIMNTPKNLEVDHRDSNGLNNLRSNLRCCTHSKNGKNLRMKKNNTSGFKGVKFYKQVKRTGVWSAKITVDYKQLYLGSRSTAQEAAALYDAAAIRHFGEFAKTNKMLGLLP